MDKRLFEWLDESLSLSGSTLNEVTINDVKLKVSLVAQSARDNALQATQAAQDYKVSRQMQKQFKRNYKAELEVDAAAKQAIKARYANHEKSQDARNVLQRNIVDKSLNDNQAVVATRFLVNFFLKTASLKTTRETVTPPHSFMASAIRLPEMKDTTEVGNGVVQENLLCKITYPDKWISDEHLQFANKHISNEFKSFILLYPVVDKLNSRIDVYQDARNNKILVFEVHILRRQQLQPLDKAGNPLPLEGAWLNLIIDTFVSPKDSPQYYCYLLRLQPGLNDNYQILDVSRSPDLPKVIVSKVPAKDLKHAIAQFRKYIGALVGAAIASSLPSGEFLLSSQLLPGSTPNTKTVVYIIRDKNNVYHQLISAVNHEKGATDYFQKWNSEEKVWLKTQDGKFELKSPGGVDDEYYIAATPGNKIRYNNAVTDLVKIPKKKCSSYKDALDYFGRWCAWQSRQQELNTN